MSKNHKSQIDLDNLIENQICPYCKIIISNFGFSSEYLSSILKEFKSLSCSECNEKFLLIIEDEKIYSCKFTCNKLCVTINFQLNSITIENSYKISSDLFEFDFSNKDELFKKLNACVVFY